MNVAKLLQLAGVPPTLWPEAQAAIDEAHAATGGTLGPLTWRKHFVRLFRAGKIASLLTWEDNRLIDRHPELADWDIAPVLNVTCNGDNSVWRDTLEGGRPDPNGWANPDPGSVDYQLACQRNYWLPGAHPRSPEARKAWYRRNACEYEAWSRGCAVGESVQEWSAGGLTALRSGDAWQIKGVVPLLGLLKLKVDMGYEVGNAFAKIGGRWVQSWYPLPGYELRACVVWMRYPTWRA